MKGYAVNRMLFRSPVPGAWLRWFATPRPLGTRLSTKNGRAKVCSAQVSDTELGLTIHKRLRRGAASGDGCVGRQGWLREDGVGLGWVGLGCWDAYRDRPL